jgi:hypothetical protein
MGTDDKEYFYGLSADGRQAHRHWRGGGFLTFCILCLVILLSLSLAATAGAQTYVDAKEMQWFFKSDQGYILMTGKPCTDPDILRHITPQYRKDFNAGEVQLVGEEKQTFCFDRTEMVDPRSPVVTVIDADFFVVQFPKEQFTPLSKS